MFVRLSSLTPQKQNDGFQSRAGWICVNRETKPDFREFHYNGTFQSDFSMLKNAPPVSRFDVGLRDSVFANFSASQYNDAVSCDFSMIPQAPPVSRFDVDFAISRK